MSEELPASKGGPGCGMAVYAIGLLVVSALALAALVGSIACAVLADRLVRVEAGVGSSVAYSEATGVRAEGEDVTLLSAETQLTCHFQPGEGGDRLARQLQAELSRR